MTGITKETGERNITKREISYKSGRVPWDAFFPKWSMFNTYEYRLC